MRKLKHKPCNNETWTEARKKGFIISALRGAFRRWGPKQKCIKDARIRRGFYRCECCKKEVPATLPPKPGNKKRIKNIVADHIDPIVCPTKGFQGYDEWIRRGFVELDGFQALCHECHEAKSASERDERNSHPSKRKKERHREDQTF